RREPHAVWYHRTTGIWQPVWAEVVPDLHVRRLHWTPDVAGAAVTLELELSRRPEAPVNARVVLTLDGEVLADQTCLTEQRQDRWVVRSEEHTSELQSRFDLVCRLLLEKNKR